MKIAVYTICKNEEKHVARWLNSCKDADYIIVADTGSTDNTRNLFWRAHDKEAANRKQLTCHDILIDPWRFDDAHNAALALVPADADICIPLHLDEVLMPGWREALEKGWLPGTTKCFYTYVFSHNLDGSSELEFLQNRIHARRGYRWKYPDHEGVYPYDIQEVSVTIPDLRIEQYADRTKDRTGTLIRLASAVREYPDDSRMAFYFGRELMYYQQWHAALIHLERYMTIPIPPFPVERAQAAAHIATCYQQLQHVPMKSESTAALP